MNVPGHLCEKCGSTRMIKVVARDSKSRTLIGYYCKLCDRLVDTSFCELGRAGDMPREPKQIIPVGDIRAGLMREIERARGMGR